jgi:hypothetical protein
LQIIFGILSGVFIAIPPLLFMVLTKDKTELGTRMGMAYAIVGTSVLVGGPGSGAVLSHKPSGDPDWTAAWTFGGCLQFAAFLVFVILRLWQAGAKWSVKV